MKKVILMCLFNPSLGGDPTLFKHLIECGTDIYSGF